MKNFWKFFGFGILGIVVLIYLSFLFILPNVVDINKIKPEIQKITKEQSNLFIDFENAKIITTPLLGAGLKADNIIIKLPDDSILFSADSFKTRLAIPSLFILTVKVSNLEINNPFINLEIDNEQFKIIQLVEEILNKGKEQKLEQQGETIEEKPWFNPAWIRIKIPNVKINNYKVLITDLETKHYLNLTGEELVAGYFNGKRVKLKTLAELYSDKNKNITANVNINTFLPPPALSVVGIAKNAVAASTVPIVTLSLSPPVETIARPFLLTILKPSNGLPTNAHELLSAASAVKDVMRLPFVFHAIDSLSLLSAM